MSDEPLQLQIVNNPSERTPCILLLDTSGSMAGARIAEVNRGLQALEQALKADATARDRVHLMVIEFGENVRIQTNWTDARAFSAPTLTANGGTPLGEATRKALAELEAYKSELKGAGVPHKRPWLFIMTDGEATDSWEDAADAVRDAIADKKLVLFPFAVAGANPANLSKFQAPGQPVFHQIDEEDFGKLFVWLSASVSSASKAARGTEVAMEIPPAKMFYVPT